jgi:hypothetical protein
MNIIDPSLPLQAAIVSALKASGSAAGTRVYDKAPTGATFPYISLGNVQVISEKAECLQGAEVYVTIDAWSRAVGKVEVKGIGADIIAALDDADLSSADVTVNSCLFDDCQYLDDPDGLTSHFTATFHILTD